MTNPNDYSPPATREPLPLHVAMTAAEVRAYWAENAPQNRDPSLDAVANAHVEQVAAEMLRELKKKRGRK